MALTSLQIGLTVSFSVLVTAALVGNSLVILVVFLNRTMQTPMNYLLVNLAVADMMFTAFITPRFIFSHTFTHPDGVAGHYLCVFVTGGNLTWTGGDASVFSLVAIAFERYFAIMHPHSQMCRVTPAKLKVLITASWLFAVFMTYPLYLSITYSKDQDFCVEDWADITYAKAYSLSCFLFLGVVPLCIMAVLYLRVVATLWFSSQRESEVARQTLLRSRKRVTRMVILVSVLYAMSWIPNLTSYLLNYYHPSYVYGDGYYLTSILLVTVNSTVNPFIYAFTNERFRRGLLNLLCHCKSPNAVQPLVPRMEEIRAETRSVERNAKASSSNQEKTQQSTTGELETGSVLQGRDISEASIPWQMKTLTSENKQSEMIQPVTSFTGHSSFKSTSPWQFKARPSPPGQNKADSLPLQKGQQEIFIDGEASEAPSPMQGKFRSPSSHLVKTELLSSEEEAADLVQTGQSITEPSSRQQVKPESLSTDEEAADPIQTGQSIAKPSSSQQVKPEPLSTEEEAADPIHTGQSIAEPSSSQQVKPEPLSTEEEAADPIQTGQSLTEPSSRQQVKPEPLSTEGEAADPIQTGQSLTEPSSSQQVKPEPLSTEGEAADPIQTGQSIEEPSSSQQV